MLAAGRMNNDLPTFGPEFAHSFHDIDPRLAQDAGAFIAIIFGNYTVEIYRDSPFRVIQLISHSSPHTSNARRSIGATTFPYQILYDRRKTIASKTFAWKPCFLFVIGRKIFSTFRYSPSVIS